MEGFLTTDLWIVGGVGAAVFLLYSTVWKDYAVPGFAAVAGALVFTSVLPDIATWGIGTTWSSGLRGAVTFGALFLLLAFLFSRSRFFDPFEVPTGASRILLLMLLAGSISVTLFSYLGAEFVVNPWLAQAFMGAWREAGWYGASLLALVVFGKK